MNTVHDLQDQIAFQVNLSPDDSKRRVRVFGIDKDGRRQMEFTGSGIVGSLPDVDMYAEVRRLRTNSMCLLTLTYGGTRRRFLWRNWRHMTGTRSSMCSISRKCLGERTACPSALLFYLMRNFPTLRNGCKKGWIYS